MISAGGRGGERHLGAATYRHTAVIGCRIGRQIESHSSSGDSSVVPGNAAVLHDVDSRWEVLRAVAGELNIAAYDVISVSRHVNGSTAVDAVGVTPMPRRSARRRHSAERIRLNGGAGCDAS